MNNIPSFPEDRGQSLEGDIDIGYGDADPETTDNIRRIIESGMRTPKIPNPDERFLSQFGAPSSPEHKKAALIGVEIARAALRQQE